MYISGRRIKMSAKKYLLTKFRLPHPEGKKEKKKNWKMKEISVKICNREVKM